MDPVDTLTAHLYANRLSLFLGADLPQSLTNLPARTDLARKLAQRNGMDETLSLAAVAQRVMRGGSRFEFTDYLGRQLETVGKQPQQFHRLIIQLPVQTIITTAYDNLLELAFQEIDEPINRLVRDSDLAFSNPHQRTLVKFYGELQQRDTLVVTEDDHYGLWRNRGKEGLLDEVRNVLRRNAVLFIGYNLVDPDFNLLWREVVDRMGHFALGAYAVYPGMSVVERRVWEERQVQIIDEEPLSFLERLISAASRQELVSATPPPQPVTPKLLHLSLPQQERHPMSEEQRQHLQILRHDHQRRLQVLERQAAQFGAHTDPQILNEIEDIQRNIAEIDRQLGTSVSGAPGVL